MRYPYSESELVVCKRERPFILEKRVQRRRSRKG